MTPQLYLQDWLAISPLLLLFVGSLGVLLLESFSVSTRVIYFLTLVTLLLAGGATVYVPSSENPLLTSWMSFTPLTHFFTLFFIAIGISIVLLSPFFHGE